MRLWRCEPFYLATYSATHSFWRSCSSRKSMYSFLSPNCTNASAYRWVWSLVATADYRSTTVTPAHTHTLVHTHTQTHTHTHSCTHTHTHTRAHSHVHTHTHTHTHTFTHTHSLALTHSHIHTHAHTGSLFILSSLVLSSFSSLSLCCSALSSRCT